MFRSLHRFILALRWNHSTCFLTQDQTGFGSFQMNVNNAHMSRALMKKRVRAKKETMVSIMTRLYLEMLLTLFLSWPGAMVTSLNRHGMF